MRLCTVVFFACLVAANSDAASTGVGYWIDRVNSLAGEGSDIHGWHGYIEDFDPGNADHIARCPPNTVKVGYASLMVLNDPASIQPALNELTHHWGAYPASFEELQFYQTNSFDCPAKVATRVGYVVSVRFGDEPNDVKFICACFDTPVALLDLVVTEIHDDG